MVLKKSLNLEQILNRLIAVGAALCLGAWAWYFLRPAAEPVNLLDEIYSEGEQLPAVPSFSVGDHEQSLIMFLSSGCPVCTDSMPFYRQLRERKDYTNSPVPIIALSFDAQTAFEGYLRQHQFVPDTLVSVDPRTFKNRRTPVLMLVDRQGTVQRVWRGRLAESTKGDILSIFERRDVAGEH